MGALGTGFDPFLADFIARPLGHFLGAHPLVRYLQGPLLPTYHIHVVLYVQLGELFLDRRILTPARGIRSRLHSRRQKHHGHDPHHVIFGILSSRDLFLLQSIQRVQGVTL